MLEYSALRDFLLRKLEPLQEVQPFNERIEIDFFRQGFDNFDDSIFVHLQTPRPRSYPISTNSIILSLLRRGGNRRVFPNQRETVANQKFGASLPRSPTLCQIG